MNRILVTGGAGFIGSHLVDRLVDAGRQVTVVDNFDAYYSRAEKLRNLERHLQRGQIELIEADIASDQLDEQLGDAPTDAIVHLAALAGVRPSLERPVEYQRVNVLGTTQLLEYARKQGIGQFVFASSSSVYGDNPAYPWSEDSTEPRPISPYASSKLAGEAIGRVYASLFGIRFVALRFFTVYGPRQRPDLAIRKFAQAMLDDQPISLFGDGSSSRDYTHVDDIVAGLVAAIDYRRTNFEVINLGNCSDISLQQLVREIELAVGRIANIQRLPSQPGDVDRTCADISKAKRLLGYEPSVELSSGLPGVVAWLQHLGAG